MLIIRECWEMYIHIKLIDFGCILMISSFVRKRWLAFSSCYLWSLGIFLYFIDTSIPDTIDPMMQGNNDISLVIVFFFLTIILLRQYAELFVFNKKVCRFSLTDTMILGISPICTIIVYLNHLKLYCYWHWNLSL